MNIGHDTLKKISVEVFGEEGFYKLESAELLDIDPDIMFSVLAEKMPRYYGGRRRPLFN